MSIVERGGGAPGGAATSDGGGGVHAVIQQEGSDVLGIEVGLAGDAGWRLRTVERVLGTRATLEIDGAVADSRITVTMPEAFTGTPLTYGDANGWTLRIERTATPVAAVPAVAEGNPVLGNSDGLNTVSNESADVDLGGIYAWANTNGGDSVYTVNADAPTAAAGVLHVFYNSTDQQLRVKNFLGIVSNFAGGGQLAANTRWADASDAAFAVGTGRFADDAAVLAHLVANAAYYNGLQRNNNVFQVMFFHTGESEVRTVNFNAGAEAVAEVPAVPGGALDFQGVVVADQWRLLANSTHTLDEVAAEIRGGVFAQGSAEVVPDADVVVTGDGDSVLSAFTNLPVGLFANVVFAGAVNAETILVTESAAAETITVRYHADADGAGVVAAAFAGTRLATAALVFGTSMDATLETPPRTRVFRGLGEGGAGGIMTVETTVVEAAERLPSQTDRPDDLVNDDLWNRQGLLVQEHLKHLAGSTRAFTSYDISTAYVTVDGKQIANINHPSNWYGVFLENEHLTDGVFRPRAQDATNRFGLNARTGDFEKSDGTDWLVYDPFADGEPWDDAYPYGAYVDLVDADGKGLRLTMTGRHATTIGENGDDWTLLVATNAALTDPVRVNIMADEMRVVIGLRARDGGVNAPSIVQIAQATIAPFLVTGMNAGQVSISYNYLGGVGVDDKVGAGFQADGSLNFANGSAGTVGVNLTRLNHWAETKAELDESWGIVGQVGLDFAGADLHALTAYTAPSAEHIEETTQIYKPPGFSQVVGIGPASVRPQPGQATLGKLYLDWYRGHATFDLEVPVSASPATGTSGEYVHADFDGVVASSPIPAAAGRLIYNITFHAWEFSAAAFVGTGFRFATVEFSQIGILTPDIGGLQANRHWLGEKADLATAVASIRDYSAATTYYFLNEDTGLVETVTSYVGPIQQHIEYQTRAMQLSMAGVVPSTGAVYATNPVSYFRGRGQNERAPANYPNDDEGVTVRRLRFANASNGPHEYFDGGEALGNIFVAVADVNVLIDSGDNLDDYTVFTLPAGRYHISAKSGSNNRSDAAQAFFLSIIMSGDDDKVVADSPGFIDTTTVGQNVTTTAYFNEKDVVLDGTEQMYLAWGSIDNDHETWHYLRIERVA